MWRLRDIVANGLLEREPCQEPGQRTRSAYTISELGQELFPIIAALAHLGDRLRGDPEKTILLGRSACGEPITTEVRCAGGHIVRPSETVVSVVDAHGAPQPDLESEDS